MEKRDVEKDRLVTLKRWISCIHYQVGLTCRRVFDGEKIPHSEKIFSFHEPHTEWISKGKAGVSVELGLRVCVLQDQFGFTLNHRVMEKETDDKVTVSMAEEAKKRFPELTQVSYDKGFWSPDNLATLETFLDRAILPKKGVNTLTADEAATMPVDGMQQDLVNSIAKGDFPRWQSRFR